MAGLFGAPEESEAVGSLCNLGTLAANRASTMIAMDSRRGIVLRIGTRAAAPRRFA